MSTAPWQSPDAEITVDADVVRRLLERDHPDLAHLPLGEAHEGWDNVTIRLGDALAVRVPRRAIAAELSDREHVWLSQLTSAWSFRTPVPVRLGHPSDEVPWAWAVVPWIAGTRAYEAPLSAKGARELGAALAQVHTPAPPQAPRNPFRSAPLTARAERFDDRVERLLATGAPVDDDAVRAVFEAGASQRRTLETWAHLDLHGANVLTERGRLAGILDWGDLGAGDPATDLGQAWCLVGTSRMRDVLKGYRGAAMAIDEAATLRMRAEAVTYAVFLAALDDEPYASAGRRALADLEVMTP